MANIILPPNFNITHHAAERLLQRIFFKESYTENDKELAIEIIKNILTQRALKYWRIDQNEIQIRYRNAKFIYHVDSSSIITVYADDNIKEKVEWVYKFPAPLIFKGQISSNGKLRLITKGFVPIQKEGRCLIGQSGTSLYLYDPKYNVVSPFSQDTENTV